MRTIEGAGASRSAQVVRDLRLLARLLRLLLTYFLTGALVRRRYRRKQARREVFFVDEEFGR